MTPQTYSYSPKVGNAGNGITWGNFFFIFQGFFPKGRSRIKKCWGWENKCNQYL